MKKLLITLALCLALIVPSAMANVSYEGYKAYGIDNYVIFVPSTWSGSNGESGNYIFRSDLSDELDIFMAVDVSHPDVDLTDPEDVELVYDVYFHYLGFTDAMYEDIEIDGMRAILWSNNDEDGTHTHGVAYIAEKGMITIFYMCNTPGHEDDIDLLLDISSKLVHIDDYYAG